MILTSKLVIRLFDEADQMLGWCQHEAAVKGDGCLRASGPVICTMDVAGTPHHASMHWADLNIETIVPVNTPIAMSANAPMLLFRLNESMINVGTPARRLPPVSTKTSVEIGIPAGKLGGDSLPPGLVAVSSGP